MHRRGVSPLIAIILLTGIALSMALATYTFVTSNQDLIFDPAREARLETVNVTCGASQIDWWLNNTDRYPVEGEADLYIYDDSGLNTALTRSGLSLSGGFTRAFGSGVLTVSPGASLQRGGRYDLELAFGNGDVEASCVVGGAWWDRDWDYRRPVTVTSSHDRRLTEFPASVTLDTATPISNGKMQDDCRDIRVVDDGAVVEHSVASCDTASTTVRFAADVAAGATEEDAFIYYGNPAASARNVSTVSTRIVNGDFAAGDWRGWTTAPASAGGQTEFWIDDFPDTGSCTDPAGTSDGPCGYPAATRSILSSGSGDAVCSAGSGCPTPVLGDGTLTLDGSSNGGGYNGNIRSDTVTVPGGVHVHWWHNLQGRSSDTGRYDSATRWYGIANNTSAATAGEGPAWALVVDRGDRGRLDGDDWLYDMAAYGNENGGATTDITEEQIIDVTGLAGRDIRVYIENNQGGGGDDGLIQVDDLYWSDASGNEITLATSIGSELER